MRVDYDTKLPENPAIHYAIMQSMNHRDPFRRNMSKDLIKLSKFLAVMLRHSPEDFGLKLDEAGFTALDSVWKAIRAKYGNRYDEDDLLQIVEGDERGKKRYEILNGRIRAMYGHSEPEIIYPPATPPEFLYHGTNPKALAAIRKEGLTSQARQYVHMTTNLNNAQVVAKRRTKEPLILSIRALEAHEAGTVFHHAETEHFLAKSIPPQFIDFPED
jgi:putative RNA 2'-phosphotransferase